MRAPQVCRRDTDSLTEKLPILVSQPAPAGTMLWSFPICGYGAAQHEQLPTFVLDFGTRCTNDLHNVRSFRGVHQKQSPTLSH